MKSPPRPADKPVSPMTTATPTISDALSVALAQVDLLQRQIDELNVEISAMRSRDSALNGYMQKLDEELRLAARLQQDFLPKKLPQLGNVRVQTIYRPAGYVSGDLYDVTRLDETHLGFYIADAVGHGMPAALLTMFMKNALVTKEIVPGGYKLVCPSDALARLNRSLCDQHLSHASFATAMYGTLDTATLQFTYARGGHPTPILIRDGNLIEPDTDGALLGIFEDETFQPRTFPLQRGDRLLVYTDGIEVAFSEDRGTVDTQAWKRELAKFAGYDTAALMNEFNIRLDKEDGSLVPKDDITLILVEVG